MALKTERINILRLVAESNRIRTHVTEMKNEAILMRSKILKLENAVMTG